MRQLVIRSFEKALPYKAVWTAMQAFTQARSPATAIDEIWLLEHSPVFTLGLAGKTEHILNPHDIPVIQSDRGGQVTYHGPGQLMVYLLFDLKRLHLNIRAFVRQIEQTIIDYLQSFSIKAEARADAPGVYVNNAKIASVGLRVSKWRSYHGLALNVAMDLVPFSYINPCGFKGLAMTQLKEFAPLITLDDVKKNLPPYFAQNFGYNHLDYLSQQSL